MRNRLTRRFVAGLVSVLLLAAQQGALAHLIAHADGQPPVQEKTQLHQKLCGKCLSSEKLCHAVDADRYQPCVDHLDYAQFSAPAVPVRSLDRQRHCCRDPPTGL